jgi:hypothetical protein
MLNIHNYVGQKNHTWNCEGCPRDIGAVQEGVKGGKSASLEQGARNRFCGQRRHQTGSGTVGRRE